MFRKRLCSVLLAGVIASGFLTSEPVKQENTRDIGQILARLSLSAEPMTASAAGSFRREVSNESPMWIIHIDSWNYADPEKIIDLVPEDILPYVVFNLSLSINWSSTEHRWLMVQDGVECARSWMKACADKGGWTMIQAADSVISRIMVQTKI